MTKTYTPAQAYTEGPRPNIALSPVVSSQVAAIGYDETTRTLAMTFTRGEGAIYCYPNVSPETFAALKTAESIGVHFGKHIKPLPFLKYRPTAAESVQA